MSGPQSEPGWYYAKGDPPGTERYWDGRQWLGTPEPAGQGRKPGDTTDGLHDDPPAAFSRRLGAFVIDTLLYLMVYAVCFGLGMVASIFDLLGWRGAVIIAGVVCFGAFVWNALVLQGRKGQTIGKSRLGLKLLSDESKNVVGFGMAFVRSIVGLLFGFFSVGIYFVADYFWPLRSNSQGKRLTDIVLKHSVVQLKRELGAFRER